jgi:hypothetical protein
MPYLRERLARWKVDDMPTTDRAAEPRCPDCQHVLPGPGAICHACDVERHFEGVLRTAPPLFTHQRGEAPQQPRAPRAS